MPRKRKELHLQRFVVVALLAVVAYLVWDKVQTQQRLSSPDYLVELANGLQEESDTGKHAQMILENRALAEGEFLELQGIVRGARARLDALKTSAAALNAQLDELQASPKGRAIAADRDLLERYQAATADYDVTTEEVQAYEQTLAVLAGPVDTALSTKTFDKPPAQELRTKLVALAESIREDAESVSDTQTKVTAILAAAPQEASGSRTLAEALDSLRQQWAAEQAAAAQAAAERVREEYREKFVSQQAEQEREQLQAELENKEKVHAEKVRAEKLAAEAEARRIAEAAEEARQEEARRMAAREERLKEEAAEREFQAALPEIKHYLAGFITPGHQQLHTGRWTYTAETKPLSLSAVKAFHGLRQDNTGYMYFGKIAGAESNDRPGGALAGYTGAGALPPSLVPDVVKAQNLLLKYSDKLIEHGMLLP